MIYVLILFTMVFLHIVDDFYLQGLLINLKQKSWWKENASDKRYRNDYKMALFIHSFSWSFVIMFPVTLYALVTHSEPNLAILISYAINSMVHAITDDYKANKRKINLIQDQCIHLVQILVTWIVFLVTKGN